MAGDRVTRVGKAGRAGGGDAGEVSGCGGPRGRRRWRCGSYIGGGFQAWAGRERASRGCIGRVFVICSAITLIRGGDVRAVEVPGAPGARSMPQDQAGAPPKPSPGESAQGTSSKGSSREGSVPMHSVESHLAGFAKLRAGGGLSPDDAAAAEAAAGARGVNIPPGRPVAAGPAARRSGGDGAGGSLIVQAGREVNTIESFSQPSTAGVFVANCPGQNAIAVAG